MKCWLHSNRVSNYDSNQERSGASVKPVTVNTRDGQNVTTITEASRICHVAVTSSGFSRIIGRPSRIFNENLGFQRRIARHPSRIIGRPSRIFNEK